ncbi:hypothetical protein L1987_48586 [Smallanthus sonchifolius]|uniref:Uncharacterized protein n=1 Tax=Smallanthus sonchifolius TaxID=185202 RepID=A0ACB9FT03_9ASTR|nr:hypothetical protein L1987_48586 [Smallanthus sonchifolius]
MCSSFHLIIETLSVFFIPSYRPAIQLLCPIPIWTTELMPFISREMLLDNDAGDSDEDNDQHEGFNFQELQHTSMSIQTLRFNDQMQLNIVGSTTTSNLQQLANEKYGSKKTISELLTLQNQQNIRMIFTCEASIIGFKKVRSWYYRGCTQCPRKVHKNNQLWSCGTHDNITEPRFM